MSRRSKGPRLYFREGRIHSRTGKPVAAVWVIRDGSTERSTGYGADSLGEAEKALSAYIAEKWTHGATDQADDRNPRDPASVYVAEVAALYLEKRAPKVGDPTTVAARFKAILSFPPFGSGTLADVRPSTCEAYVAHRITQPIATAKKDPAQARRVSDQGARRELEDLSAAIGFWNREHPLTRRPVVSLPEKAESQRDALTRHEAARLLKAARGYRLNVETGQWKKLPRITQVRRRHMPRFILTGLYTGTRPGVIPKILWHESPTQAWADLAKGTIYRRGKRERDHRTKRRPIVRVPGRLLGHMRRWFAIDMREQQARRAAQEAAGEKPDFTLSSMIHHNGQPITGRIRGSFESIVRDAGLDPAITPHWLRHTCATWLMERGADPWEAAGFTGMTTATLESCYGHHRPDHQSKARGALGGKR